MTETAQLVQTYEAAIALLRITYTHIVNLRKLPIDVIVSQELIDGEERALRLLATSYYCQQNTGHKSGEECYLNALNLLKILNSSNFVVQATKRLTTVNIAADDIEIVERRLAARSHDVETEKFIAALTLIREIINTLKSGGLCSAPSTLIRLPNDYLYRIENNVVLKINIMEDLKPRHLNLDYETSSLSVCTSSPAHEHSIDETTQNQRTHKFSRKTISFLEACHHCNKFAVKLNACAFCGIKAHTHCLPYISGTCLAPPNSQLKHIKKKPQSPISCPIAEQDSISQPKLSLLGKYFRPSKTISVFSEIPVPTNSNPISPIDLAFKDCQSECLPRKSPTPSFSSVQNLDPSLLNKRGSPNLSVISSDAPGSSTSQLRGSFSPNDTISLNHTFRPKISETRLTKRSTVLSDWLVSRSSIKLGSKLYKNRFGDVYVGDWHGLVTITVFTTEGGSKADFYAFRGKIQVLRKTRHDKLALFVAACIEPPMLAVINDFVQGECLYTKIYEEKYFFSEGATLSIIGQVLNGLGYLHSRMILHMNLNTRNIFYSMGKIKLCDFALVSTDNQRKYIRIRRQPYPEFLVPGEWLHYQAPEVLSLLAPDRHGFEVRRYTKKTDIFSFGVIYHELMVDCVPWSGFCAEGVIYNVCKNTPIKLQGLKSTTHYIIRKCLEVEKRRFASVSEIEESIARIPRKCVLSRAPSQPNIIY